MGVVGLALFMAALAVGPNLAYVEIELSEALGFEAKFQAEVGITLVKTVLSTLVIPLIARRAVRLLMPSIELIHARFRLRLIIATAIYALSTLAAPFAIVLVTDARCLKYHFEPREEVTTDVGVEFCTSINIDENGRKTCTIYATNTVQSTYTPTFEYSGERCVSAILEVYAPVFLASVFLTAVIPALFEVYIVPSLAPWCHRRAATSRGAQWAMLALRALTWNVSAALALAGSNDHPSSGLPRNADYLAQRIVERGFAQMMGTLLVALTMGTAAPAVGLGCAVAAAVQLAHTQHVLGQLVGLGVASGVESPAVPNLMGCNKVPVECAAIVAIAVLLLWGGTSARFLDPMALGTAAGGVLLGSALVLWALGRFFQRRKRWARRGVSGASVTSAASTVGVLLQEPMLPNDEGFSGTVPDAAAVESATAEEAANPPGV